jgi:hypothetical protein
MAICKKEIVRQLNAFIFVTIALLVLFGRGLILETGERVQAMVSPRGFRVYYYNNAEFAGKPVIRSERQLFRDYGEGAPVILGEDDEYSARWVGQLEVPKVAAYVFFLQSQGGARLFLDDELIVDKWDDHEWTPGKHGNATLDQRTYRVVLEHYKTSGPGAVRLRWAGGTVSGNTVMGVPHVYKKLRFAE